MIDKAAKIIARARMSFARVAGYVGMVNFALLIGTFKKAYEIEISALVLIPIGIVGMLVVGWLDYMFVYTKEIDLANKQNKVSRMVIENNKMLKELQETVAVAASATHVQPWPMIKIKGKR